MLGRSQVQLGAGARVAVIGGGPAGSYFALSLFALARRTGISSPQVVIFEHKHFSEAGPRGCNSCAGIVQSCMLEKVARLGVPLGEGVVQGHVRDYIYHTRRGESLCIRSRPSAWPIIATYRGGGPAFTTPQGTLSYDDYMLGVAEERGARIIHGTVTGLRLAERLADPVHVECRRNGEVTSEAFDFVVCAPGLHPRSMELLEGLGFGYVRPRTVKAFQAELPVPRELLDRVAGDVNVFGPCMPGLAFAALVPKQGFLTLSLVGFRDLDRNDLTRFLSLPWVRDLLPEGWEPPRRLCQCHPRVALTSSRQPYTDRLVVIGDANCGRLYKGGIDSAYITATFAAEAALLHGVDRATLRRHFHARCQRHIGWDNCFGEVIFAASKWMGHWSILEEAQLEVARRGGAGADLQQDILWGLFTGEATYASLVLQALNPVLVLALARAAVMCGLGLGGSGRGRGKASSHPVP